MQVQDPAASPCLGAKVGREDVSPRKPLGQNPQAGRLESRRAQRRTEREETCQACAGVVCVCACVSDLKDLPPP